MLEKTQNSSCGFADQLVSYLYDEMGGSDKSRFQIHLAKCEICSDELSGFASVRTAVQEWRETEFLPLANPVVEIPYPQQPGNSSRSWFAQIRDLFTLSPAWMTASTALAALAIGLGLFAVMVSSLRDDTPVVQQTEINNPKIIPTKTDANQNRNSTVSEANQIKQNPVSSPEPSVSERSPKPAKTQIEPTRVSAPAGAKNNNLPVKTIQPRTNNKPPVKQTVKTNKTKAPSFLDEDEEEDALTLTDLLEQIGTRKIDD